MNSDSLTIKYDYDHDADVFYAKYVGCPYNLTTSASGEGSAGVLLHFNSRNGQPGGFTITATIDGAPSLVPLDYDGNSDGIKIDPREPHLRIQYDVPADALSVDLVVGGLAGGHRLEHFRAGGDIAGELRFGLPLGARRD
jgi:hypothetical protein